MQLATARIGGAERWGVVEDDALRVAPASPGTPRSLRELIESGEPCPAPADWARHPLDALELLAPLPEPRRNVMCLGLNYLDHAAETQGTTPAEARLPAAPIVFTKATTAVTGPYAPIALDPRVTRRLDWEVELAVVIGRGGRFIPAEEAAGHVFGYTVVNDLSARERQKHHQQFFLAKSMDGSCPMGPTLTTADAVADPEALEIGCRVNGVTRQASRTDQLVFGIGAIVAAISEVMTLLPGDVIATGTPGGVGFARSPPEYLQPGDVVESWIEGLGCLRNEIVAAG